MAAQERYSADVQAGEDPAAAVIAANAAVERFAMSAGLSPASAARLAVVAEELVSNVVRHGARAGAVSLDLALWCVDGEVALELVDDGVAFDPLGTAPVKSVGQDVGGAVGLALVRAWARDLAYARENGRNRLSLTLASTP